MFRYDSLCTFSTLYPNKYLVYVMPHIRSALTSNLLADRDPGRIEQAARRQSSWELAITITAESADEFRRCLQFCPRVGCGEVAGGACVMM